MEIKTVGIKVPHMKQVVARPDSGQMLSAPWMPRLLKGHKFSKNWDINHVKMELTSDNELIFWVRGTRFESKFLGESFLTFRLTGYSSHRYIDLMGFLRDGKIQGIVVSPSTPFSNERADFSMFIKAYKDLGAH